MTTKLGQQAAHIWTKRRETDARTFFDNAIKRQFNPYDRDNEETYEIPLNNSPDIPEIGLTDGYLSLGKFRDS